MNFPDFIENADEIGSCNLLTHYSSEVFIPYNLAREILNRKMNDAFKVSKNIEFPTAYV